MSCPFNEEQLKQLNAFVELCKIQPSILNHPKLSFFKDYLLSLGVSLPTEPQAKPFAAFGDGHPANNNEETAKPTSSDSDKSEPESDIELDMEGVIESDPTDANQEMGDPSKEVTDEERDQSDEKRSAAMRAFSEQNFDEAISLYTEAIQLNPQSALLFAKRGQVYLKMNKLYACIKDCSHALELNCDSAAAYKFRGRAYRLLGKFEEASHDLCESLKIDYDDQANEWLNEVKPNAEKIRHHKLSVQRKAEDKQHREKVRAARRAQEAGAQAAKEQSEPAAAPFQMDIQNLIDLMKDPELSSYIKDPEVINAFYDVSGNPDNYMKYQNNPKIKSVIDLIQNKLSGAKMPPSVPGAGGFPGAGAGTGTGPKPFDDDVGLD